MPHPSYLYIVQKTHHSGTYSKRQRQLKDEVDCLNVAVNIAERDTNCCYRDTAIDGSAGDRYGDVVLYRRVWRSA